MKLRRTDFLLAGFVLFLAAAGVHRFAARSQAATAATTSNLSPPQAPPGTTTKPASVLNIDPQEVTNKVANFIGSLKPGGTAESAGQERNYVVSYQVDFFRKSPKVKVRQESLTYAQLQVSDDSEMPPYVYYGETVQGTYNPAQPDVIAVHANIDGKETKGYVDSAKLWLEPKLDRPESERYMAVAEAVAVRVVPDPTSPPVVGLLQGEVVDVVGRLTFQGRGWVKARFNVPDRPRYGFVPDRDVQPLVAASINQSALQLREIPKRIRESKMTFGEADRQRLSQNGFYIEPLPSAKQIDVDDMADAYQNTNSGQQFFVTSDLYLHAYHLIFDRMMQDIEEKKLLPSVREMSKGLAKTAESAVNAAPPNPASLREASLGDLLYFSVAAKLFDPNFPVAEAVRAPTEAIVSRIQAAQGQLSSTVNFLGPDKEDFTQYKIRGHYEKNEALKQYFRGMMWYGRHNFLLSNNSQTLSAILLPNLVETAGETRRFQIFDGLVTYLIGKQDKYTLAGYRSVNQKVFGTATPSLKELSTNLSTNLKVFRQTALTDLHAPQIVSVQIGPGQTPEERLREVAGLKFLGQRYVLDAFLLNQLTSPNVGTDVNPRNVPSALDVMMLLGSSAATELQQKLQKERQWAHYDGQVAKLKGSTQTQLAKPGTFYDEWLYSLQTLFQPTLSKQAFAVRAPWQYKTLNTALASWTELKHDTILYAEQSEAEMGGGSEFDIPPYVPPGPKGYIEPNPAFFLQLAGSAIQLMTMLKNRGYITDEYIDKLTQFGDLAQKAEAIAQKEVSGDPISREDYEWIEHLRWSFDSSLLLPRNAQIIADKNRSLLQMALIADVATDGFSGQVLEEGVGTPQVIVAVVKDAFGGTRLTVGYVYSWYEFASKRRWNDTEWKKIIYEGVANARKQQGVNVPVWYTAILK